MNMAHSEERDFFDSDPNANFDRNIQMRDDQYSLDDIRQQVDESYDKGNCLIHFIDVCRGHLKRI